MTQWAKQSGLKLTAAPEAGRATDHMVRFLAPLFGVRVAEAIAATEVEL